jgi:hypothetical protein
MPFHPRNPGRQFEVQSAELVSRALEMTIERLKIHATSVYNGSFQCMHAPGISENDLFTSAMERDSSSISR